MWFLTRNRKNTVNTTTIVVVFVPGVMGTRLSLTGLNWDPDAGPWGTMFAKRWGYATLAQKRAALSSDTSDDVVMDRLAKHGTKSVASDFYANFLKKLAKQTFASANTPVYAVGYDWRIPIVDSGATVWNRIAQIMNYEKAKRVVLVTHSMGGLVTRAMLKDNATAQKSVAGVIHVVQPTVGAVALYRRLFTGMRKEYDGGGIAGWVLNRALGETPAAFATLVCVLPGAIQLCASGNYRRGNGWLTLERDGESAALPQDSSIFDAYGGSKSPPGVYNAALHNSAAIERGLSALVAEAKEFHNWIDVWKLEGKTWAIYSTKVKTDVAIDFKAVAPLMPAELRIKRVERDDFGATTPVYEEYRPEWPYKADGLAVVPTQEEEGDGTVPQNSGNALFPGQAHELSEENTSDARKRQFEVEGVEHAEAFKSSTVQTGVIQLVQRAITSAVSELSQCR